MPTSHVPPQSSKYGRFEFANDNRLFYNYPGVLAAKNGFTDAARHTYVAVVAKGHRRLLVTLLHGEQAPIPIWQQVVRLVEWGARVPESAAVGELVPPGQPGAASTRPGPTASPAPAPSGSGAAPAGSTGSAAPARTGTGMPLPIGLAVGGVALLAGTLTWVGRRRAHR
jgi:D-alanyl-D-alanine carboxypeptidase (penicillin-binding protein 5/6)